MFRISKLVPASLLVTAVLASTAATAPEAAAHCQVPCGIYDDHARVHAMLEDVTTIAKAVDQIAALASKNDPQSLNQKVRWITTKEAHASNIITVVAEYFLTQKIKPHSPKDKDYATYLAMLVDHHAVMAAAMKAKQTVDKAAVDRLRVAVVQLQKWWPKPRK
jgi:nickel superoxide dismutase